MMLFCTYLTIYSGNKLPPFYIGSTTVEKIANGYHGSIRSKRYQEVFKTELKENPHLFKTKIIKKYHSRKMALYREKQLQVKLNVVRSSMYINQSIATINGMFGRDTSGELHPLYGIGHSNATCQKISDNHHDVSGANNPMFGCTGSSNPKAKRFWAIDPDGVEYDFIGLIQFCKNHNLTDTNALAVAQGKHSNHKGWQFGYVSNNGNKLIPTHTPKNISGADNANAKTYKFINPEGQVHLVTGRFLEFCKENNLYDKSVRECLNNKRTDYKSWKFGYA